MSAIVVTNEQAVFDMLLCFVLGLGISFVYQITTAFFPFRGRVMLLLWHIVFFAAAGLVAFCFCIGVTTCKEPRWQLVFGFVLGLLSYLFCFSRTVRFATDSLIRLFFFLIKPISIPLKKLHKAAAAFLGRLQSRAKERYNRQKQKKREAKQEHERQEPRRQPIQASEET